MAWCVKCNYGHEGYKYSHCGRCQGLEMTNVNPFLEAFKNPQTLYNTKKGPKKGSKDWNVKVKAANNTIKDDVEAITGGGLKSRNYQDMGQ